MKKYAPRVSYTQLARRAPQGHSRESIVDFYIEYPFCSLYALRHATLVSFLPCIKLLPTNSDRLQGFIQQTLINLIIDRIATRTRDQKEILVHVIILPTEIFGNFRSHAMSRYNSWNNFIRRVRITPPPPSFSSSSRAPLVKAIRHDIEYQTCLRASISRHFLFITVYIVYTKTISRGYTNATYSYLTRGHEIPEYD